MSKEETRGRKKKSVVDIDKELKKLYYDDGNQFGIIKFYKLVRSKDLPYSRQAVIDWLRKQKTYQLTRPAQKSRSIQAIAANKPFKVLQVDLTDYGSVKLLTLIDVFTKYGFVKRIKDKSAEVVRNAILEVMEEINELHGEDTRRLLSDNGPEFKNEILTAALDKIGVKQMFGQAYTPQSQGVIERFNGTFKKMLKRAKLTQQFITPGHAFIKKLVKNYNNSYHRSINMTPVKAIENVEAVLAERKKTKGYDDKRDKDDIEVGDKVRIQWIHLKDKRNTFEKSDVNWSKDVYTVSKIRRPRDTRNPFQYRVVDKDGDMLEKVMTRRDLQKIHK